MHEFNLIYTALQILMTLLLLYMLTPGSYIIKRSQNFLIFHTTKVMWLFISILLVPFVVFLMLTLSTYRHCVRFAIKIKHGKKFGGLLDAADIVHALETPKSSKLGTLFLLKYQKNSSMSFYKTFKAAICTTKLLHCPKASAIIKKSLGYYYYLKNIVTLSECIHKINVTNDGEKVTDKSTFMKFLHETENVPLPHKNTGLWDVFIGTHPIEWNTEDKNENFDFYPILFRYHHSLFDGYHLIQTILNNFSDDSLPNKKMQFKGLSHKTKNMKTSYTLLVAYILSQIQMCFSNFYIIIIAPWRLFTILKTLTRDSYSMQNKKLSDKKLFAFEIEKSPYYIDVIRTAKSRLTGSSFTDILLTAISVALTKHLKTKESYNIPPHITVATPEVPYATNLLNSSAFEDREKQVYCQNKVMFSLRTLPIGKEILPTMNRLKIISKQRSYFKNPTEVEADYKVSHMCFALLPVPALVWLSNTAHYTAIVTNLPGPKYTSFCNGHYLQDLIVWSISKPTSQTGISFVISTYDNRLGITMTADKAVISNCEDLQTIIQNIYVAIDNLSSSINHHSVAKAG